MNIFDIPLVQQPTENGGKSYYIIIIKEHDIAQFVVKN